MPKGSFDDMLGAFQNRIDELSSGVIDSAEDIVSSCKGDVCETEDTVESTNEPIFGMYDEDTEIDNIVNWIAEHPQAYEDFNLFFEGKGESLTLDDVIGWISDHDMLYEDFCARFPEYCEDIEACSNITSSIEEPVVSYNELIDKFCWEIHDAVMGSAVDCDNVECTFSGENFTITVEMPDGSEEDFIVPISDLTCDVETLSDDLDYVVATIEAELL